jgi:CheY-like chemotaxis protein
MLVEDDENKRDQILLFLSEQHPFADVSVARSLQSGVKLLKRDKFAIILLDMTLPNFDVGPDDPVGGITHSFGGREFLKQVKRLDIETDVVVVTQFESFGRSRQEIGLAELDLQLRDEFGDIYLGSVYYHPSIDDWKDQLSNAIVRAEKNGE